MKRISVTVSLNRSTLQFDDAAYARLEQYLAESARLLEGDPDSKEILSDLDQAVADQCSRRLGPGQSVVTLAELGPALEEIGSVQAAEAPAAPEPTPRGAARPLQQVSEGAVVSGVSRFDGQLVHLVAYNGVSPEVYAMVRAGFPIPPSRASITARAVLEGAPVHIDDVQTEPGYSAAFISAAAASGYRGGLAVPMFKEGKVIGSCYPRHRNIEFRKFLRQIDRSVPAGLDIHMILDNYGTHNHPKVKTWRRARLCAVR